MKTVILAAGKGTRLRPITNNIPKPMVRVGNRPFLEHILDMLKDQGFKEIILCVGYLKESIMEHFKQGKGFGVDISYSISPGLGTSGEVKNAGHMIENTFIVMNGDSNKKADLHELIRFHKKKDALATLCLTEVEDSSRYGSVKLEDGKIISFDEKTDEGSGIINAGVYVLEPEVLDLMPEGESNFEKDVFPLLLKKRRLFGKVMEGFFIDIGTKQDYLRAQEMMR